MYGQFCCTDARHGLFQRQAKETAGIRVVVIEKDAENLVDGKEKQSGSTEHGRDWSSVVENTL